MILALLLLLPVPSFGAAPVRSGAPRAAAPAPIVPLSSPGLALPVSPQLSRETRLPGGARLVSTLSEAQIERARAESGALDHYDASGRAVRRNLRAARQGERVILEPDEIYVVTHSRFEQVNKKLQALPSLLRLARERGKEGEALTVLDWGAGEGRTLVTLKEELDRRGVTNVEYLGYSAQYFPRWESLPPGIRLVFDTPENLAANLPSPDGLRRPVDYVLSHYGLDLAVNARSLKYPERHSPAPFALLRGLLAKDGEIRSTNVAMPLDGIRALGFKVSKIPVRPEVWNKPERENWKMSAYRFQPTEPARTPPLKHYWVWKDGRFVLSPVPGRYAGWRKGKIFGRLDHMAPMKPENRVFFLSWDDALAAGYRPCKVCKPVPSG